MVKILDCTIRDGGHLNKWDFDYSCVKASYFAAVRSGVDYFEIGYRFPDAVQGQGVFAYCREELLREIIIPSDKCKLAVMIDVSKSDESLFEKRTDKSLIRAIRVATYPDTIKKALSQIECLKNKGYEVFLNLMAYSELSSEHFKILSSWKRKEDIQAIYFADSFGSFLPEEMPEKIKKLGSLGFKSIGFHPHNNTQMAFANTLAAIQEGVDYVDASVFGMGRGSGNLPIEALLGYMEKKNKDLYNSVPYLDVIERYYDALYKKIGWGYAMPTFLAGLKGVHTYYSTELFSRRDYTIDEIWDILDIIKKKCPVSYSTEQLNKTLDERFYVPVCDEKQKKLKKLLTEQFTIVFADDYKKEEKFVLENKFKGRDFMILANGPSIKEHEKKIKEFCETRKCITIGVNRLPDGYEPDFHVFVNRKRFLRDVALIKDKSILIVPSFFGKKFVEENYKGKYIFFEVESAEDYESDVIKKSIHRYINLNVSISAMLIAFQMGAKEICVSGMDGYIDGNVNLPYFYNEDGKPDEKEIASLRYDLFKKELERLNLFLEAQSIHFSIITPTSHKKYFRNIPEVNAR